jgi:hypothetical protein
MKPGTEYARNRRLMQHMDRQGQANTQAYLDLQRRNDELHVIMTARTEDLTSHIAERALRIAGI